MKKNYSLLLLFRFYFFCFILFSSIESFAQKEHNIWYFGYLAGLDFNTGSPVALTNGALNSYEGCSSICDASGNLLFYTDGSTIWNRNHIIMANGSGLTGNATSTQSGLIVKQPGNPNLYYVFTTFTTLNYSVVDMTLNGGLGDVTSAKNVFLANGSEKICGTKHANGTDTWILSHETYTNGLNAFLLSSTGVSLVPVASSVGFPDSCGPGQMKFSPVGNKVAIARCFVTPTIYLADFDNATGVVSGGFPIPTSYPQTYGVEFSPDGSKLYGGANVGIYKVYQFDLNAGSPAAIIASSTQIGVTASYEPGSLQLAPDNKIYIAPDGSGYLDAIDSPNVLGLGCHYVQNAVSLAGRTAHLGLPTALPFPYLAGLPPTALYNCSDTVFCSEPTKCINFFDHSTNNPTSWQWLFPGATPDTSSMQNPTNICYGNPGTYAVTLIVANSNGSDTLVVSPMITVGNAVPATVAVVGGDTLVTGHASAYQWYFNGSPIPGATDSVYVAHQQGTYSVIVVSDGCSSLSGGVFISSVSEIDSQPRLVLFPNPVSQSLGIRGLEFGVGARIEIFNMIGEKLYGYQLQTPNSKPETVLDVSGLSNGIYMLRINLEGGTVLNRKFIILK